MSSDLNHAVDINFDIIDDDEWTIKHSDSLTGFYLTLAKS